MSFVKRVSLLILGIVILGAVSACTGARTPHLAVDEHPLPQVLDYEALLAAPDMPVTDTRQRLVDTAKSFLGTPSKRGGKTPEGFDCTGYIFYVYQQGADITLPRKSHDQVQFGKMISPVDLQPGDLIYFSVTGSRSLHLGLYLGEGDFIHAPSTRGAIRIESLGSPEWRTRFLGARRVLPS